MLGNNSEEQLEIAHNIKKMQRQRNMKIENHDANFVTDSPLAAPYAWLSLAVPSADKPRNTCLMSGNVGNI